MSVTKKTALGSRTEWAKPLLFQTADIFAMPPKYGKIELRNQVTKIWQHQRRLIVFEFLQEELLKEE